MTDELPVRGELRAGNELPPASALYEAYGRFAVKYFAGKLPPVRDVTIEWSARMTRAAGYCYPRTKTIRLSTHYHRKYPEDIEKTLLHEMIHLLVPNHGPRFYAWMERIRAAGGRVERYPRERATPARYRWVYTCITCGATRRTLRRLKDGGKYHRCRRCHTKVTEQRLTESSGGVARRNR